jgi:CTP:molybdopterin cytidylyltransferase MocA
MFSEITAPIQGLILAGGASSRMGQPKALLTLDGATFVAHLVGRFLAAGCASVAVVGGADAAVIEPAVPTEARFVYAADWAQGMRASLRAGLRALPAGAVLLTHVDRPRVAPETLAALLAAPRDRPVVPMFEGQGGHPVVLPAGLRARLLEPDDTPLNRLLLNVRGVAVADADVLRNVNTQADYEALLG